MRPGPLRILLPLLASVALSMTSGELWAWDHYANVSATVTSAAGAIQNPNIARDRNGTLHVVWSDIHVSTFGLYYARSIDEGTTWSTPRVISGGYDAPMFPSLAVDGLGRLHVVFLQNRAPNERIVYLRSTDGGQTFGNFRVMASGFTCSNPYPRIAADDSTDPVVHVVWSSCDGQYRLKHSRSLDAGLTWADQDLGNIANDDNPAITTAGNYVHVVTSSGGIVYLRSTNRGAPGSWSTPAVISGSHLDCAEPAIVATAFGDVHVAFSAYNTTVAAVSSTRYGATGTWGSVKTLPGLPPRNPAVVATPDGIVRCASGQYGATPSVWIATSADHGSTWPTASSIPESRSRHDRTPTPRLAATTAYGTTHFYLVWGGDPTCYDYSDSRQCVFFKRDVLCTQPQIVLAPTTLTFVATRGQALPASQTFSVQNPCLGTLGWSVTGGDPDWAELSPTSGTGNSQNVTVSITTTDLPIGHHQASVVISSGNASNSPQTLTLAYDVIACPPPVAPSHLVATPLDGRAVRLAWQNHDPCVEWIEVRVANDQPGGWTTQAYLPASTNVYIDRAGAINRVRYYRVVAVNSSGEASMMACATPLERVASRVTGHVYYDLDLDGVYDPGSDPGARSALVSVQDTYFTLADDDGWYELVTPVQGSGFDLCMTQSRHPRLCLPGVFLPPGGAVSRDIAVPETDLALASIHDVIPMTGCVDVQDQQTYRRLFRVLDGATRMPIPDVLMKVTAPGGPDRICPTDGLGVFEVVLASSELPANGAPTTFTVVAIEGLDLPASSRRTFCARRVGPTAVTEFRAGLDLGGDVDVFTGSVGGTVRLRLTDRDGASPGPESLYVSRTMRAALGPSVSEGLGARADFDGPPGQSRFGAYVSGGASGLAYAEESKCLGFAWPPSNWQEAMVIFLLWVDGLGPSRPWFLDRVCDHLFAEEGAVLEAVYSSRMVASEVEVGVRGTAGVEFTLQGAGPATHGLAVDAEASYSASAGLGLARHHREQEWSRRLALAVEGELGASVTAPELGPSLSDLRRDMLDVDLGADTHASAGLVHRDGMPDPVRLDLAFRDVKDGPLIVTETNELVVTDSGILSQAQTGSNRLVSGAARIGTGGRFVEGATDFVHGLADLLSVIRRSGRADGSVVRRRIDEESRIAASLDLALGIGASFEMSLCKVVSAPLREQAIVDGRVRSIREGGLAVDAYPDPYASLIEPILQWVRPRIDPAAIFVTTVLGGTVPMDIRTEITHVLGDGRSTLALDPAVVPTGVTVTERYWGLPEAARIAFGVERFAHVAGGHTLGAASAAGAGGFHLFEPADVTLNGTATLTLHYDDATLGGGAESRLAVFREDPATHDGTWIGGTVDTVANTVTVIISSLGTYTLGEATASGEVALVAAPDSLAADGVSSAAVWSDTLRSASGAVVMDGTPFTVSASGVDIVSADARPDIDGIQVLSAGGRAGFVVRAGTVAGAVDLRLLTSSGRIAARTTLPLGDVAAPVAPAAVRLVGRGTDNIMIAWSPSTDPDVAGYRVYFDDDGAAPYTGYVGYYEVTSPVDVGCDTTLTLFGLVTGRDYTFAVVSYDVGGRESGYRVLAPATPTQVPRGQDEHRLGVAPNPARGRTAISFRVGGDRPVDVVVVDVTGRRVASLLEGSPVRELKLEWDGRRADGAPAAAGIYFVHLRSGKERLTRRVALLP